MEMTNEGISRLPTATGFAAGHAVALLRTRDIDPAPLLERLGLSEQNFNKGQIRVSADAQARLLEAAAEALRDPALGLHLADGVNPREMGLLFYVTSAGKDLGEALALFVRYCRIVNEAMRLQLKRRGSDLVLEGHVVGIPRFRATQSVEFGVAIVVKMLREITGRHIHPTSMTLAHVRNAHSRELERFCGCPIEFGGSPGEIVFSPQSLAAPLITKDVYLLDALRPICDEAAKQRETATGSLRAAVENEAQKLLPHGQAHRHNVAKRLAMSTRTLARKLASEGTTFEEVIDELRRSLALQYINTPSLSLSQMAWLLGYEGSTSFNHAFRRWTGAPPSAARVEKPHPAIAGSVASVKSHDART
jgi:AraC-like DNA-binding protein